MCGIAGFTSFCHPEPEGESILRAMAKALAHRGPDGQGLWREGPLALAHRRLSIIDLAGGAQPMSNENGEIWVVFNGEIYNFQQLRHELLERGHVFTTHSDTEVLVHGWEEWGSELFARLNGMFAMALAEVPRQRLILARDRLGKKPLHWMARGGDVCFASEIKSLLTHPWLVGRVELDLDSLARYLSLEYVPTPHCLLAGVRKLRPGHYLEVSSQGQVERPYWSLEDVRRRPAPTLNFDEGAEHFWDIFSKSVERRLFSDVPLGVFLSGGLDSLAVSLVASQHLGQRLETFSIGFRDSDFDESAVVQATATCLGIRNHLEFFTPEVLIRVLPVVLAQLDEPMADTSLLPTYLLCQSARRQVKVALSGDGSDEQLAGYPTFQAHALAQALGTPGAWLLRGLAPLLRLWPAKYGNLPLDYKLKGFLRGLGQPAGLRFLTWMGAFDATARQRLLTPQVRQALSSSLAPYKELAGDLARFSSLSDLSALYLRSYLENDILVKVDRASMYNSLEVRSPFLDPELVEFLATVPDDWRRRRGWGGKALLKQALSRRLPPKLLPLLKRPKQGFGAPIATWMQGPLKQWAGDLLAEPLLRRQGLFEPAEVARLWQEHQQGRYDHRKLLWTLLVFQNWWQRWLEPGA